MISAGDTYCTATAPFSGGGERALTAGAHSAFHEEEHVEKWMVLVPARVTEQ